MEMIDIKEALQIARLIASDQANSGQKRQLVSYLENELKFYEETQKSVDEFMSGMMTNERNAL